MQQSPAVDRFKNALHQLEAQRDATALVALFADDATLDAPTRKTVLKGTPGATEFWSEYLDAFQKVSSRFTREAFLGETAVLEWVSEGVLPTGRPIEYRGVSIIHFRGDKVASLTTYYDSAAFVIESPAPAHADHGTNDEGGD